MIVILRNMAKENHHDKSLCDYPERTIKKIQIGMDEQAERIPCSFVYHPHAYNHFDEPNSIALIVSSKYRRDNNRYDWRSMVCAKNSYCKDEIKKVCRRHCAYCPKLKFGMCMICPAKKPTAQPMISMTSQFI